MRSYSLHILKLTYFAPFILCIVCALVFQCKECIYITFDKLSFCGKCGVNLQIMKRTSELLSHQNEL